MKNKLFYLACAAFMLFSMGTFTACTDDETPTEEQGGDDQKDDSADEGKDDGSGEEEENVLNLNGTYSSEASADGTLTMTYNGGELTGKSVTFLMNEDGQSAVIEMKGQKMDLANIVNGISPEAGGLLAGLGTEFTTYSPIPGEKEVVLNNVSLTLSEDSLSYAFEGEDAQATRTMTYKGTIKEGEMSIDIINQLANQSLAGTWNLADAFTASGSDPKKLAPFWFDCSSNVNLDLGKVVISLKGSLNKIINTLCGTLGSLALPEVNGVKGVEKMVAALLEGVTALPGGNMYASYVWNDDWKNPQYSSEMSHNIMRYYYSDQPDQVMIEVNADYIANAVSSMLGSRAEADPEATKEIGRRLLDVLRPVLEEGIPCTYELDETDPTKMSLNLDGTLGVKVLQLVAELLNDPYAKTYVEDFINGLNLGEDISGVVSNLIAQLPYVLNYAEGDAKAAAADAANAVVAGGLSGTCDYVKIGLKFEKAEQAAQ